MNHVKEILGGLAVLIAVLAMLATMAIPAYMVAEHNRAKVEHMTSICVDHGYRGWSDDSGSSGCTR